MSALHAIGFGEVIACEKRLSVVYIHNGGLYGYLYTHVWHSSYLYHHYPIHLFQLNKIEFSVAKVALYQYSGSSFRYHFSCPCLLS